MGLRQSIKSRGFSLLELIITIAILSMGITMVLQAFSFSARSTGLSCDIIKAVLLAQDKIQELEFNETRGIFNNETFSFEADKFSGNYSLRQDADLSLYTLNLNLFWQRANREEELKINTYLR